MQSLSPDKEFQQCVKARILREQAFRSKLVTQIRHHDSSKKKKTTFMTRDEESSQNKIRVLIQAARSTINKAPNSRSVSRGSDNLARHLPRALSPLSTPPEFNFRTRSNSRNSRNSNEAFHSKSLTSLSHVSEIESFGTVHSSYNPELLEDVHGVFKEMYQTRFQHARPTRRFTSRLKTPPELAGDVDYGGSQSMVNSMIDDIQG